MNKKIVITGATKGIGRAIAEKFAGGGFDVAVCARNSKDLSTFKGEIEFFSPDVQIITAQCDVSDKAQVKSFAEQVMIQWDYVDVIVNNAGIFLPGQVINEDEGTLEKLIETNLYSAYHLSRMLLPMMMKRKSGHIFNMTSIAGIKSYANGGSYSISKFAMLGLSKALREELKSFNIKVTALIPGAVYTDSWAGAGLPESRFMKAEDIAKTVWDIYNLSDTTVVEEIILRPMLGDI